MCFANSKVELGENRDEAMVRKCIFRWNKIFCK